MAKQLANKIGPSWHISNNRGNNMIDVVDGYTLRQHLNNKTFCEWRIVLPNRNRFDPASQIQLAPQMRKLPPKKDNICVWCGVSGEAREQIRSGGEYRLLAHQPSAARDIFWAKTVHLLHLPWPLPHVTVFWIHTLRKLSNSTHPRITDVRQFDPGKFHPNRA